MRESVQLGDLIKTAAIGKKINFSSIKIEFEANSIYIKIDDIEANVPYEATVSN